MGKAWMSISCLSKPPIWKTVFLFVGLDMTHKIRARWLIHSSILLSRSLFICGLFFPIKTDCVHIAFILKFCILLQIQWIWRGMGMGFRNTDFVHTLLIYMLEIDLHVPNYWNLLWNRFYFSNNCITIPISILPCPTSTRLSQKSFLCSQQLQDYSYFNFIAPNCCIFYIEIVFIFPNSCMRVYILIFAPKCFESSHNEFSVLLTSIYSPHHPFPFFRW